MKSIDIANEHSASRWFEAQTGDENIVNSMHDTVHGIDPDAKCFLNQYGLINAPTYTQVRIVYIVYERLVYEGAFLWKRH